MYLARSIALLRLLLCVAAQSPTASLYIPGFEPQPISAGVIGIGPDGHTTWALQKGTPTDSSSLLNFPGTATLVEAADYASFTYANSEAHLTLGQVCSLSGGNAICTIVQGGSTAVQTEVVSHAPVQGQATVVASPSVTSLAGTTPIGAPTSTSSLASTPTDSVQESGAQNTTAGTSSNTAQGPSPSANSSASGAVLLSKVTITLVLMGWACMGYVVS